ncbi:LarC family nickel insertion protein [Brachybacterium sp. AOP43-C2-M15]|uniref:LarC family nickel insertion protein n=1 Tax=Brachybacterium sp. AOP43-C2-M15 TaxID=3457661 RepID=UPI004033C8D1
MSSPAPRLAYIDATAGIAGDMLLAALVDAGADLDRIQRVLDALVPGSVRFVRSDVDRGGQRAVKVDVEVLVEDPPHRTWSSIRELLERARGGEVPEATIDLSLAVFGRLAEAEGTTHGVPADEVHFHEVGALDSLADVIGACEAWRQLGVTESVGSVIAVGSGRIRAAHGDIPVPVPAVARLALGWPTVAGELLPPRAPGPGHDHTHPHAHPHTHPHAHPHAHSHEHAPDVVPDADATLPAHARGGPHEHGGRRVPPGVAPGIGELATPTGVALMRGLASSSGPQPMLTADALGVGAGTKDTPGRPNVVRVLVGGPVGPSAALPADAHDTPTAAVELAANVDDLDPRLWPGVIDELLDQGALDAWHTSITMKRGRPAVTVHALVREGSKEEAARLIMDRTGTLGVRRHRVERLIRTREFDEIEVRGQRIAVKIARDHDGRAVRREPEFRDVAAAARALGISERAMLDLARESAAGLTDPAP